MSRPIVALTTTLDKGKELADLVLERGCDPVLLPCIETVAADDQVLDDVRKVANEADLLIVTSARVITTLWPGGDMPQVPVGAVGKQTAEAVKAADGMVEVTGVEGAWSLIELLGSRVAGKEVLFPHAAGADLSTVDELRSLGAIVSAQTVYETRPLPPADLPVDAVLFGSPSAVTGWCLSRDLDRVTIAAIGATTAGALARRGYPAHVVAARPDYETLVDAATRYLSDRSPV